MTGIKEVSGVGVARIDRLGVSSIYKTHGLFTCCGQSNDVGHSAAVPPFTGPFVSAYGIEIKTDNTIVDPITEPTGQDDPPFDPASTGGAWPAFCDRYYTQTGQIPIMLVLGADSSGLYSGGIDSWLDGTYALAKTRIDAAMAQLTTLGYEWEYRGFVWWQGYTDGIDTLGNRTAAQYQADLNTMYGWWKTDYASHSKAKFYVMECPYQFPTTIQVGKQNFVAEHGDCYMVYDNKTNSVHLNQDNYNIAGQEAAEKIAWYTG